MSVEQTYTLIGFLLQLFIVGACTWIGITLFIKWLESKSAHYRHMADVYERYTTAYVELEGLKLYRYSSSAISQRILTLRNEVIRIEMEFPEVKLWRENLENEIELEEID